MGKIQPKITVSMNGLPEGVVDARITEVNDYGKEPMLNTNDIQLSLGVGSDKYDLYFEGDQREELQEYLGRDLRGCETNVSLERDENNLVLICEDERQVKRSIIRENASPRKRKKRKVSPQRKPQRSDDSDDEESLLGFYKRTKPEIFAKNYNETLERETECFLIGDEKYVIPKFLKKDLEDEVNCGELGVGIYDSPAFIEDIIRNGERVVIEASQYDDKESIRYEMNFQHDDERNPLVECVSVVVENNIVRRINFRYNKMIDNSILD